MALEVRRRGVNISVDFSLFFFVNKFKFDVYY